MLRIVTRAALAAALLAPLPLAAGQQTLAEVPVRAAGDPAPCSAPEYRQLDFYLGDWDVRLPDGTHIGTTRVERLLGDCAVSESWTSVDGTGGHSLNTWSRATGRWHQTWIDSQGSLFLLFGGLEGEEMVFAGAGMLDGKELRHRLSLTPLPGAPARVRQLWLVSRDGGASWEIVFDAVLTRR